MADESLSTVAPSPQIAQLGHDTGSPGSQDSRLARKSSTSTKMRAEFAPAQAGGAAGIGQGLHDHSSFSTRDSNTNRLKNILEEPALRSLFREFLRQNFCEENLSFWLDVQDFKRRFHTTSSAVAVQTPAKDSKGGMGRRLGRSVTGALVNNKDKSDDDTQGLSAMEKHQQDLVSMAFVIYDTYLAPSSPCELNIDHNLRTELILYMNKILTDAKVSSLSAQTVSPSNSTTQLGGTGAGSEATHSSGAPTTAAASIEERKAAVMAKRIRIPLHASQLQVMVRLYERIQDYIFRLMATDSVPRFIKDARFIQLVRSVEEYTEALEAGRIDPSRTLGLRWVAPYSRRCSSSRPTCSHKTAATAASRSTRARIVPVRVRFGLPRRCPPCRPSRRMPPAMLRCILDQQRITGCILSGRACGSLTAFYESIYESGVPTCWQASGRWCQRWSP